MEKIFNRINNLDTLKVFLINKYVNPDFTVSDLTCKSHSKIEYSNIDEIILYYLKDNFKYFEVLELLSSSSNSNLIKSIKKVGLILSKKTNNDIFKDNLLQNFIFDYKIDLKEIQSITLSLLHKLIENLNKTPL